jgi:MarR family transcriptional regulator, temperature-dependent positive regulator of motility
MSKFEPKTPALSDPAEMEVVKVTQVTPVGLQTSRFDPNQSPSHMLHRAQQVGADLHVDAFGASGLTQRQVAVLAIVSTHGGLTQTDLVAKTGIDRSTLAEMVARMETKGLMVREKSVTDSRAKLVSLTPEGQAAIHEAVPKLIAIDKALLSLLSAGRRQTLMDLLSAIGLPPAPKVSKKSAKEALKASKKVKTKKKEHKKKKS